MEVETKSEGVKTLLADIIERLFVVLLTVVAVVGLILLIVVVIHSLTGAYSPGRTFGLSCRGFLITHGRTPLDE
jgi:hypothetical protein